MMEADTHAIKVVVVGGSFAGRRAYSTLIRAARQGNVDLDVTLVDSRGFWEYTPGILRCLVEPKHARNILFSDDEGDDHQRSTTPSATKRSNKIITALALGVSLAPPTSPDGLSHSDSWRTAGDDRSGAVRSSEADRSETVATGAALRLSGGQPPLPFDYLVLTTGSRYTSPIKPAMRTLDAGDGGGQVTDDPSAAPAATGMLAPHPDAPLDAGDAGARRSRLLDARMAELEGAHRQLQRCSSVAIIGGGTVGVELAAEIVGRWGQEKAVTLITSHDRLLERMAPSASKHAHAWLERRGVRVWTGDRVSECRQSSPARPPQRDSRVDTDGSRQDADGNGDGDDSPVGFAVTEEATDRLLGAAGATSMRRGGADAGVLDRERAGYCLETASGRQLEVDVVYRCVGFAPNGAVAADIPGAVDSRGFLCVDRHLRVRGTRNIFAAGDSIGIPDEKTALTAELSATLAAENVLRRIAAEGEGRRPRGGLLSFPQDICNGRSSVPIITVVSLYKHEAIMQYNRLVVCGRLPALFKWVIETLVVGAAKGYCVHSWLWGTMEKVSVYLSRWLFA